MSEIPPFSKKGQRVISSFVGQELLFDFITDQLDEERKRAVTEFIQKNRDAQNDIQKIQNGMSYAQKLSETRISESLIEKVTSPANYFEVMIRKTKFEEWSPAFKLAVEGTIVALGVISLVILVPWHRLMDLKLGPKEVVLAEIDNQYAKKDASEADTTLKQEESFPDEGVPAAALVKNEVTTTTLSPPSKASPSPAAEPVKTPKPEVVVAAKALLTKPTPSRTPSPAASPVSPEASTSTAVAAAGEAAENESGSEEKPEKAVSAANSADKKTTGELYRGRLDVTNVPAITPKLVDKIAELGGRKAGEVELGWNKGHSSYFHFTMPQGRYDELLAYFKEYGNLKVQKEKHERVMPEGVMRLIITVEEKR